MIIDPKKCQHVHISHGNLFSGRKFRVHKFKGALPSVSSIIVKFKCWIRFLPSLLCFLVFCGLQNTSLAQQHPSLEEVTRAQATRNPSESLGGKSATAAESFSSHSNSIFQIRIMNASSKSQSSLGSGFFVGDGRLLATNYHVVSSVVLEPQKYVAEIDIGEVTHQLEVVGIDVIHDLAVLSVPTQATPLNLSLNVPNKGARLYSIGNPLDIGMTVVEGNYNGLVENRFFDQVHFSGAVNSGMSGGPTLDVNGDVVGINVASAGNQVGFLVPVDKLAVLVDKVVREDLASEQLLSDTGKPAADKISLSSKQLVDDSAEAGSEGADSGVKNSDDNPFFEEISQQIQAATHHMINQLLDKEWPSENLGEAKVVGKAHKAIDCWGDSAENNEKKMKIVQKGCNSRDGFYISRRLNSGYIEYEFSYSEAENWPVSAFYQQMTRDYAFASPGNRAGKKDVDNFSCLNRIITRDGKQVSSSQNAAQQSSDAASNQAPRSQSKFKRKVSYCTRPYKKLKGLFDTFYMAVTLEKSDRVLMEHFTLSGVSKDDGERFLKRFIDQVNWK